MATQPSMRSARATFKPNTGERRPAAEKPKSSRVEKEETMEKPRESILEKLRGPNSMRYFIIFLGTAIAIQIAHDMEHVVQNIQVFFMGVPRPVAGGLFGSVFDFPVVHFVYNFVFFIALLFATAWAFGLGGFQKLDRLGMWALVIAAGIQTYHAAEHVIQIAQEVAVGTQRPPGFIGFFQDNVIVHLFLNSVVWVLPAFALWRFGGFGVYGSWIRDKIRRPTSA